MTIGMEVVKFFVANSEIGSQGQGMVSVHCSRLWNMSDKEFKKEFIKKKEGIK